MKKLSQTRSIKKSRFFLCTIVLLLFIGSCTKDNFKEKDQEPKKTLAENSPDLKNRLAEIKRNFYLRKLEDKLKTNIDENLIWMPEWDNPRIQTVNDSVSYVFYPLIGHILKDGKLLRAEELGAKSYIIVKNEKYYFRGRYYQPNNQNIIKSDSKLNEINTKNFTGKLFLSNLEVKENYVIDYKNGEISDTYHKNGEIALKKLQSNKGVISFFENYCHTEMKSCTYYTYLSSCGGGLVIEYSYDCQQPSYCQNSIWILGDYNIEDVCESVWFPDPPEPIDPGNGGSNEGSNDIPDDPILPGQEHPAIDIKKYTKCFDNIPNAGATYKVIVQVLEPVPGTSYNYGPINGVGHTAITMIKQGSNGLKTTQTVGFYPTTNSFSSPSKMVNNSDQTDYTIRMIFDMGSNSTDFNKIISSIENPPSNYQLLGMNCTAFVVGACAAGGITLPNANTTVGPYPAGSGAATVAMTPGGLGSSMRSAHASGDSRISSGASSTGNNPASNGPCN
ncbi:hypothetical protein GM921_13420 [Pedobacter sp. LMG 31464]|uniref:Uncharacterized protein n=1 Tax=Pedobacter planticolens TaxID=2679964 RepID=A0A923DYP6_9SPHI|nr:hypothetical protein [Pedobacter planticolens]MBB2146496.1 hypothetical protein [Pedobacter planticolens]